MQLGYVILTAFAPAESIWAVAIIVIGIMLLSWIVWRIIERPTQRWTKNSLTALATRRGWAVSAAEAAELTTIKRSPA
jgi:peptidoglycan/LPS O-acetylase OafA/YrhL